MSDQVGPEADPFAAGFRDGAAMAREWIEGKGDLPDLVHIVRDMPRGGDMGGLEAGFLASIDAAVRGGREGAAASPDLETAKTLLTPSTPSPEAAPPPDWDEVLRRGRERERAARRDKLWREISAFPAVHMPGQMRKDADWGGW